MTKKWENKVHVRQMKKKKKKDHVIFLFNIKSRFQMRIAAKFIF